MDFQSILLKNEGRDLYIKLVHPEGEEEENVLKNYRVVMKNEKKREDFLVMPEKERTPIVEFSKNASVLNVENGKRIPLITIEAQYRDVLYYMYITDYISAEKIQF